MSISSLNKPDVTDWELITTSTPSGLSTVTLSSIDTIYSKLLLTFTLSATYNGSITMTLNNDGGNNYISLMNAFGSSTSASSSLSSITLVFGASGNTDFRGYAVIDGASTANLKTIITSGTGVGGTATITKSDAIYAASAAISRIDLALGTAMSGTVKLYGVRG